MMNQNSGANKTFTVSSLNNLLKEVVEGSHIFYNIRLQGELQGYKRHITGHYFFTLKDSESSISSVIFSYSFKQEFASFKDGDKVEVVGTVNFYNKRGTYSFVVNQMFSLGEGDVLLAKKRLIEKLKNEGLFDLSRKKPIPKFPTSVGIITSKTGAAIADIEHNIYKRTHTCTLYIFPCIVQGKEAPNSIIQAIEESKKFNLDTIIIGRGGGSMDDLSAFDNEQVVRAVHSLKTPVIAAVGHEIDKSIVDYVADLSVSTPTAAAMAAVPDDNEIKQIFENILNNASISINLKLNYYRNKLYEFQNIDFYKNKKANLLGIKQQFVGYESKIQSLMDKKINQYKSMLLFYKTTVENINPDNILSKGYSIIFDKNNNIIKETRKLNQEDTFKIKMADGEIEITKEKK